MLFFFPLIISVSPLDCISLHAVACRVSVFAKKYTFGVAGPVKHEINQCHIFHALLPAHPGAQIKFHTEQSKQLTHSTDTQHTALTATRWTSLSPGSTSTLPPSFGWQNLADSGFGLKCCKFPQDQQDLSLSTWVFAQRFTAYKAASMQACRAGKIIHIMQVGKPRLWEVTKPR